jgi:hypothetical protein
MWITSCGYMRPHNHRGFVEIFYAFKTTRCRTAWDVVGKFWPEHRLRHGQVARFRCTRYPKSHAVFCYGPRRQFVAGMWTPVALPSPS